MQTKCWIFDLAHNPENWRKDLSSMPAWFQTAIITTGAICYELICPTYHFEINVTKFYTNFPI